MDSFRIDAHKLLFHPRRVADWLEGRTVYPLYIEVSPSGACNHRCRFCGLDFMGYKPRFLDADRFGERLDEMGRLGVKSIMYAGEGEPFLHKRLAAMVLRTKAAGIDAALTTNAVLMKPELFEIIAPATTWIKVSLNAGSAETYGLIHGTSPEDFGLVLRNLERAVAVRQRIGAACTLGAQLLLLPENRHEVVALARTLRDLGLDYLVVKPYSQHPQSLTREYGGVSYADSEALQADLTQCSSDTFQVIWRGNAVQRMQQGHKTYGRCLALPFWSYIDAGGGVWGCSVYLQDERFAYGNIMTESFQAVWEGERRRASLDWCARELDPAQCRVNCRMDPVNAYLWELMHPGAHVNFI